MHNLSRGRACQSQLADRISGVLVHLSFQPNRNSGVHFQDGRCDMNMAGTVLQKLRRCKVFDSLRRSREGQGPLSTLGSTQETWQSPGNSSSWKHKDRKGQRAFEFVNHHQKCSRFLEISPVKAVYDHTTLCRLSDTSS